MIYAPALGRRVAHCTKRPAADIRAMIRIVPQSISPLQAYTGRSSVLVLTADRSEAPPGAVSCFEIVPQYDMAIFNNVCVQ